MKSVVTFGEMLMRFSPINHRRLIQSDLFYSCYSGAEANVAVSLAYYGDNVKFVTKFPDNILGDAAENELRKFGVDTSNCLRGGKRLGIYFTEKGASQRESTVLYDRSDSSFDSSCIEEYDWKEIFKDSDWFHFSGINIALNENIFLICKNACVIAKQLGVKVCFDINYRSTLIEKSLFLERAKEILPYVDLLVGNEQEVAIVAGYEIPLIDLDDFEKYVQKCYKYAVSIQDGYNVDTVAISLRKLKSASETSLSGMMVLDDQLYVSNKFEIKVEEVIGSGDAFVAGLLDSFKKGRVEREILDFAVSASCLKHTLEGDFNLVKEQEVEQLMKNHVLGVVKR